MEKLYSDKDLTVTNLSPNLQNAIKSASREMARKIDQMMFDAAKAGNQEQLTEAGAMMADEIIIPPKGPASGRYVIAMPMSDAEMARFAEEAKKPVSILSLSDMPQLRVIDCPEDRLIEG